MRRGYMTFIYISQNSNNNANIFTQHKDQKSMIYYI